MKRGKFKKHPALEGVIGLRLCLRRGRIGPGWNNYQPACRATFVKVHRVSIYLRTGFVLDTYGVRRAQVEEILAQVLAVVVTV